jgi:hypothetical protein
MMGYVLGFYEYGFDSDIYWNWRNNKAIQLVMDGLKLINCENVGFVEGTIIKADAALYVWYEF